ncbi:MAG: InlB B-repeat-containing protein, partial [Clostridia bacterium]|nr:InlB B-repeat-containing protein [Clostridia bacterium]
LYLSPEGSVYSESFSNETFQPLYPDNILWSPSIDVPADGKTFVNLWVRGADPTDYAENFRVGYALPGDTAMTPMSAELTTENCWIQFSCSVNSNLKGQTVRFCIEHYDTTGKNRLYLDDFEVVNTPLDGDELLSAAANAPGSSIAFSSEGEYPWKAVNGHVMSGNAGVGDSLSTLTATVTVDTIAALSFAYGAHGEGTDYIYDACEFYVDDTLMFRIGDGGSLWSRYNCYISDGTHELTWIYSKDYTGDAEGDCFALDNVYLKGADELEFDIWIRGSQVTGRTLNGDCYNYDPASKTLTLTGDVACDDSYPIEADMDGLTVYVAGDCDVTADGDYPAMRLDGDTTITGPGALNVTCSTARPAIYCGDCVNLTFYDANVTATSVDGDYAINAVNNLSCLYAVCSDVTAESCVSAVFGFGERVFPVASRIAEPENAIIGPLEIFNGAGVPATRVRFAPAYPEIGAMCAEDTGDNGTEGQFVSMTLPAPVMVSREFALPDGAFMTAGAYGEGYYYAYSYDEDDVCSYYTRPMYSGAENGWVKFADATNYQLVSISFDNYTGSLYGVATNIEMMGDRALVKIDRATGAAELIKLFEPGYMIQSIAFGERGVCYGLDFGENVYIIDTETGELTLSFSPGLSSDGYQGFVYDSEGKAFYWLQYGDADRNGLYVMDPVSGSTFFIGIIGSGMRAVGAAIMQPDDTPNYAVRFDANGGRASKAMIFSDDADKTLPTATGEGEFLGWFTAPVGGERVTRLDSVDGDVVLYAHFDSDGVMKGDLDKDGEISVGDALIALRIAARLQAATDEDVLIGDVDSDGEITVGDALLILRVAARLADQSSLG